MHELAIAAAKMGWTPEELDALVKSEILMKKVRGAVRGSYTIDAVKIDCTGQVVFPSHWTVESHIPCDSFFLNSETVELIRASDYMKEGETLIHRDRLLDAIKDRKPLNVVARDFLVRYPELIPDEWMMDENKSAVLFAGTVFGCPSTNSVQMFPALTIFSKQWEAYTYGENYAKIGPGVSIPVFKF